MSSIISVDTQSVVRGLAEDTEHLDRTRSIAFKRDLNTPKPYGSTFDRRDLQPTREIIELVEIQFPRAKRSEVIRKARRLQYLGDREHHRNIVTCVPAAERVKEYPADAHAKPEPTLLFRRMLKHNTPQANAISTLWSAMLASIEKSV
jgi:hypothetical protein